VHIVYRREDGTFGDQPAVALPPGATAASVALASKADEALRDAVVAAAPGADLPVAIWLAADPAAAVGMVVQRHPEVDWIGDRPVVDDLATLRTLRAELDAARRAVYSAAQAAYRQRITALGGTVAYESTSTPLVFADLPAGSVAALAADGAVTGLGLEQAWSPSMATAGPAVQADWTGGSGDQGIGVRVAVVEYHNVRPGGDLTGHVVASHSTSGSLAYTGSGTFDHPTWVAGAVASQNGTWRGVAPGAVIVSSGTGGYSPSVANDRAIIAAADWAVSASGGDADIVNTSLVQDTATGAAEARRYFDAIAYESGRLPVSAAGNYVNFNSWTVGSPGTGWNVLTVGGIDDRSTLATSDDRMWYVPGSNGSNYADPPGTAWNRDGDFNKPDVAAPAVGVRTANGLAASGTSVATPIVAGIAAQLMARSPTLATWPEAVRAIIMAGAVRHTVMPDGSVNADHEGAGTASALWANRVIGQSDSPYGGMTFGTMSAGSRPAVSISVTAGQRVRVALAWSSHTSGAALTKADTLTADLDLRLTLPGGVTRGSYTLDNASEWVDFVAPTTGTARIEILGTRFDAAAEPYGLAWAKISPPIQVVRYAGADRYMTAATISRASGVPTGGTVYVATGANFADALGAGPAAAAANGSVLLVQPRAIPPATAAELERLAPARIVIAGGTGVVSSAVEATLRAYAGTVVRQAGVDRYATAAAISAASFGSGVPVAFVATGESYPDALSGGAAAAMLGGPMLLTRRDALAQSTADELRRLAPQEIVILGGSAAVSTGVEAALRGYGNVTRLAGADRYATAAAVSARYFATSATAWLATGAGYPDALVAAPVAGRAHAPLLLTAATSVPASTMVELRRLRPARVNVAGGTAVIGAPVISAVHANLDP
jgi:putative cell wall-binding protein